MLRNVLKTHRHHLKHRNIILIRRNSQMSAMDRKVIVRRLDGERKLTLSFKYSSPLITERIFNFNRDQNEDLKTALARINSKIIETTDKKARKMKKKMKTPEPETKVVVDAPKIALMIDGKILNDTETTVSEAFKSGAILKIGEVELQIEVNPPLITKVSLPENIMTGFNVYPKIEIEFSVASDCRCKWYRNTTDSCANWEEIAQTFSYEPINDDIGRFLKVVCTPCSGDTEGPSSTAISVSQVGAGPGQCPFERRHLFTSSPTNGSSFRVVTYNLLADAYANSDYSRTTLFPTCPPYALAMDYRKQLLVKELMGYNADIICLQEVDFKLFKNDLTLAFSTVNIEGHLASKAGGKVAEGLACFYNKDKFRCIRTETVVLKHLVETEGLFSDFLAALEENEQLKNRFMNRTTVLQISILESLIEPGARVCVANTHLYFHPNADHIRLLQSGVCLRYLEQIIAQEVTLGNNKIGVIFCGDFNSTPESGVYQLVTTQFIPTDYERWNSAPDEEVKGLSISHSLGLISACGTPDYTNYCVGFNGCLDYIYSDSQYFDVTEVVPLPSHEEVVQFEALPSLTIPSDHLALICTLDWKKN
uniref:2',5'-phosphodiesterase 12 n=1 Tax=Strigamia maritima TaxID=126957 RepID=T1J5K1_STRMM